VAELSEALSDLATALARRVETAPDADRAARAEQLRRHVAEYLAPRAPTAQLRWWWSCWDRRGWASRACSRDRRSSAVRIGSDPSQRNTPKNVKKDVDLDSHDY
jgi:hypothetical protein